MGVTMTPTFPACLPSTLCLIEPTRRASLNDSTCALLERDLLLELLQLLQILQFSYRSNF